MRHQVYSIFDRKVAAFNPPFYMRARGEAIRSFTDAVADKNSMFSKYPEDFSLQFLGYFDDESGLFDMKSVPEHVIHAHEVVAVDPFPLNQRVPPG